jgi:hypothetical protein
MADQTQGNRVIQASLDEVAHVILEVAEYPLWVDAMKAVAIEQRDDLGRVTLATFEFDAGLIKDRLTLSYRYSERLQQWDLVSGSVVSELSGTYAWEETADGVKVTYSLSLNLSTSLPSFLKKTAERTIISTALDGLSKRILEVRRG